MLLKILLLYNIFNSLFANILKYCEINNYCGKETNGCSVYGNCNFNIFEFYKTNSSNADQLPHCECNTGYSSYHMNLSNNDYSNIQCCYKKKGMLTPFFLELFLGFGIGHFYLGNYIFAVVKLTTQISLCVLLWCTAYFACSKEHSFQTNYNEINNNEKNTKNNNNENKNNENKDKNKEIFDENENYENESNENKNNDSKNQSFELEENRENEIMFKNFISCPKSMFLIYLSSALYFLYNIVDITLIAFGVFKDGNGEELYMWI